MGEKPVKLIVNPIELEERFQKLLLDTDPRTLAVRLTHIELSLVARMKQTQTDLERIGQVEGAQGMEMMIQLLEAMLKLA
jgi:hypothetical protein